MVFHKTFCVILVLNCLWFYGDCARILCVFSSPAKSHQMIYRTITKELLNRGHHITLLSPDPINTTNPNITQIDWSYTYEIVNREWNMVEEREKQKGRMEYANLMFKVGQMLMEAQLKHPQVIQLINSKQYFDLVFVEYLGLPPILAFGEHFQAPIVGITSFDVTANGHAAVGNVHNPIAHPEIHLPFYKNLNFFQRVFAVVAHLFVTMRYPAEYEKFDRLVQQVFGGNVSNSFDLMKSIDLLITYGNPALDFIRPTVPATITIHSIHIQPPKPLPADLQKYLDNSTNGCIYVSFGSLVKSSTFSKKTLDIFLNSFRNLKYNILMKWEADTMDNKPDNVKIMKWLPQQDILAHPNVKLFITQAGTHSTEEAIDRHVPIIAIPFIVDQFRNSHIIQEKKIGKALDLHKMTSKSLTFTIHEVITNKSYKRNIIQLAKIARDEPMKSLDKAVWWIEYVIRHQGAKELKYHGISIPFYQYHFYDIIGAALAISLLLIFVFVCLLKYLKRKCALYFVTEKTKFE